MQNTDLSSGELKETWTLIHVTWKYNYNSSLKSVIPRFPVRKTFFVSDVVMCSLEWYVRSSVAEVSLYLAL